MSQKEQARDLNPCCRCQIPRSQLLLCHTGWRKLAKELGKPPGVKTAWSTALFSVYTFCSLAQAMLLCTQSTQQSHPRGQGP